MNCESPYFLGLVFQRYVCIRRGSQPAVILTDGEEAPSRLASRQDPPHLVQRLLPHTTVRLHSHVVMGNDERGVRWPFTSP